MPLFYDWTVRARLEACPSLLGPTEPDTDPTYGPMPRFVSLNEQRQLERLDDRVIYAELITEDNPWSDHQGNPIPVGDYAITRSDGVVFGSAKAFFESVWAPYVDFSEPLTPSERYDIVA